MQQSKINSKAKTARYKAFRVGKHFKVDQEALLEALPEYARDDIWDVKNFPVEQESSIGGSSRYLRFEAENKRIRIELKAAYWKRFFDKQWSVFNNLLHSATRHLCRFFNSVSSEIKSLLDYSVAEWKKMAEDYYDSRKALRAAGKSGVNKNKKNATKNILKRIFPILRSAYSTLQEIYDTRPPEEWDLWRLREMGATDHPSRSENTLNFANLNPLWLRDAAKICFRRYVLNKSVSGARRKINAIKKFGSFVAQRRRRLRPEQISRDVLLEFVDYLSAEKIKSSVRRAYLEELCAFFRQCYHNKWLALRQPLFLFQEDFPRKRRNTDRSIPQFVLNQLEAVLHHMPADLRRMTVIIRECGMRVSELCELKIDCLERKPDGIYVLRYTQRKTRRDHLIPVSEEIAEVIEQQRAEILSGGVYTDYLFPARDGNRPTQCETFNTRLNFYAKENKITDQSGKLWRFRSHAFRHSVGTKLINQGTPLDYVQRFLGHSTLRSTFNYVHLNSKTKQAAFEKYLSQRGELSKITDININRRRPETSAAAELQRDKKYILAQSLPNGYCALPAISPSCPHANSCLSCASFKTDASFLPGHKSHLGRIKHLVQISRNDGASQQAEINEKTMKKLKVIIKEITSEIDKTNESKGCCKCRENT